MDPVEICRRMGEAKTKAIFLELTTEGMKKILREAKLPTTRMPSHTTTRKRNDDWAARTWRVVSDKDTTAEHHGVRLSADRLRIHLRRARISWQRTSRTLRHKQDPAEVAERQAVLDDLAKKGMLVCSICAIWTSNGKSIKTGPGRPERIR